MLWGGPPGLRPTPPSASWWDAHSRTRGPARTRASAPRFGCGLPLCGAGWYPDGTLRARLSTGALRLRTEPKRVTKPLQCATLPHTLWNRIRRCPRWQFSDGEKPACGPGGPPHRVVLSYERTKRLRTDEEYRFPNGTGERSKAKCYIAVPGPQVGHRLARGTGCNPEPAHFRASGPFQDASERPPLTQRAATDGGASPPVVGLPAQLQPRALQGADPEPRYPPLVFWR